MRVAGSRDAARAARTISRDGASDRIAVEEPLEIRVRGEALTVTMRTPGNDEELALGFLFAEGLIERAAPAGPPADLAANTVDVDAALVREPDARRFFTSSSCGVCGKGALEEVVLRAPPLPPGPTIARALLAGLPDRLVQPGFAVTGGLQATGLFSVGGEPVVVREDVGRHNAMDKVIGWALQRGLLPLAGHLLCVSGRLSYELVQKAAVAGAPVLVGVGAPTTLAVDVATEVGMTLVGFARGGTCNVYAGAARVS